MLPSGNYSRSEESVSVGKGLGVREGEKEGPCESCRAQIRGGCLQQDHRFNVKFVWSLKSFSLPWRLNPWKRQGGRESRGEINPQIKVCTQML